MTLLPITDECRTAEDVRRRAKLVARFRKESLRPPAPPAEAIEEFRALAVKLEASLNDGDIPTPQKIGALKILANDVVASFRRAAKPGAIATHAIDRAMSLRKIMAVTSDHFGLTMDEFLSARRTLRVSKPRHIAMYLAYKLTNRSLPDIGRRLGGRDHTTILHGVRVVQKRIDAGDQDVISAIREIEKKLSA